LAGNEAVLDIGCGDGKITALIAKSLPIGRVVGIDSSPPMINLAASSFPKAQYPNLSFQLMDAKQLAFTSEFDIAFSNAALHWILDQKGVLLGAQMCLKAQGRLLF
jgi:trans-aconitate 2-methyltransferase